MSPRLRRVLHNLVPRLLLLASAAASLGLIFWLAGCAANQPAAPPPAAPSYTLRAWDSTTGHRRAFPGQSLATCRALRAEMLRGGLVHTAYCDNDDI